LLTDRREVETEEGEKFARENDMLFIETSAKTGINIEKTFLMLGEEIYHKVKENIIDLTNDVTSHL
jgi:GTPase SAR1 family protein